MHVSACWCSCWQCATLLHFRLHAGAAHTFYEFLWKANQEHQIPLHMRWLCIFHACFGNNTTNSRFLGFRMATLKGHSARSIRNHSTMVFKRLATWNNIDQLLSLEEWALESCFHNAFMFENASGEIRKNVAANRLYFANHTLWGNKKGSQEGPDRLSS